MEIQSETKYLKTKDPNWVRPAKRPDYVKDYNQQYRLNTKAEREKKVKCSCGKTLANHSMREHLKTKYHAKHSYLTY